MGFGIVFIGYLTLLFFKTMPPAMAAGAYLMYRGLKKLSAYGKDFKRSATVSGVLGAYFVLYTALWIGNMSGIFPEKFFSEKPFMLVDDALYYAILLVMHIFLYRALEDISRQTGYEKGIKKAYFSRVLMAMFYVLTVINTVLQLMNVSGMLTLGCVCCQLVFIVYTAMFVYSCYMRIATEEIIEEEERKIAEYDAKFSKVRGKGKK